MTVSDLPLLNAVLNFISAVLLLFAFVNIKKGNIRRHMKYMWSALGVSVLFLVSYLVFHFQVGSVGFDGTGWIRPIYFTILISHIILAAVIVPMVLITLYRAVRERFEKHRRIARWTWPLWMYVSVTGVIVYLFMEFSGSYDKLM